MNKMILPEKDLNEKYLKMSDEDAAEAIKAHRARLGSELIILTHHYQRDEIVELGDLRGDSLELSRGAARSEARYIIMCGVHFMAESAAILARAEQAVFIPDLHAGCPMASMADPYQVERAWSEVKSLIGDEKIIPVTYINSDAELKAFCGLHGGATCTSSNVGLLFDWAYSQAKRLFFFPDQHLGRNTAEKKGVRPVIVWNPQKPLGGNTPQEIKDAKLIVWNGFCHVHTFFTREQVSARRREFPGCKVIVHPECDREVVLAADADGSTSGIIKYIENAREGSTVVVGTEINLVRRLARQHAGKKNVVELAVSSCPNMYKINLRNLLWTLEFIGEGPEGRVNQVTVPDHIRGNAGLALQRMLEIK